MLAVNPYRVIKVISLTLSISLAKQFVVIPMSSKLRLLTLHLQENFIESLTVIDGIIITLILQMTTLKTRKVK